MKELLIDAFIDTIKILPYLFITFLLLEFIEHKLNKKVEKLLIKSRSYGPIYGSVLGALPQCGFSTMAASLFSSNVITKGTLIAVFLSTSDEMIPLMISRNVNVILLIKIIGFKILCGILIGFLVDIIFHKNGKNISRNINHMCEEEGCSCNDDGIFLSSFKHTLKIGFFILFVNILISLIILKIGENRLANILVHHNILSYFGASLIGLIPNCASSVILTECFLSKVISVGMLMSGLLTGSGLGLLVLFRTNKNIKENLFILCIIYLVGAFIGLLIDLII